VRSLNRDAQRNRRNPARRLSGGSSVPWQRVVGVRVFVLVSQRIIADLGLGALFFTFVPWVCRGEATREEVTV
jgi:hypothetical protein